MPGAKVRFHPNGGGGGRYFWDPCYYLDDEGYSEAPFEVTVEGPMDLWDVDTLFYREGYIGAELNWRVNHPTTGTAINYTSIDLHNDYAVTYPETTITLYAQWTQDLNKTFSITYLQDASGLIKGQGHVSGFGLEYNHPLNAYIPETIDGKVFTGWGLEHWAASPKYYINSDFYLHTPADVRFYEIYQTINTSKEIITFDPNGGFNGPRVVECSSATTYSIPGGSIGTSISDSDYPTRPGYKFTGWHSTGQGGETKQPGTSGVWWYYHNHWTAQWDSNLISITTTPSNPSFKNTKYDGYKESYKIDAVSFDRQLTLTFNTSTDKAITKRTVMLRIIDQYGDVVPNSFIYYEIGSGNSIPTANPILLANQNYYLEFVSEKVTSTGQTYSFHVSWKPVEYEVTINPNEGQYYISDGSSKTEITSNKFKTSDTYVRISSNSADLSSVGGSTGNNISLPSRTGYQFKEWNCFDDDTDINEPTLVIPRNISGYMAQTTLYAPQNNFTARTLWNPNIFYVVYHNNDTHQGSGYMSDTEHYYNVQSNLWNNQYKKFAKITFNSRGGTYNNSWTNDANLTDIATDTTNSSIKSAVLNHTFLNWKVSNTTYSNQQAITLAPSNYGDTVNLYAQWQIESFTLPAVERAGFDFMGWYTDPDAGELVGMNGEAYSPEDPITLYAHWEPIGLVQIYVNNKWKYAIPYVYDGTSWKRTMQYTYNGSAWKQGAGSGQNMTDEQLENL